MTAAAVSMNDMNAGSPAAGEQSTGLTGIFMKAVGGVWDGFKWVAKKAFDFATVKRIHIPVEIVLGSADPIAPPGTNGELLARLIPGARLKVFPAVGHYDFLSECGPAGAKDAAAYCTDGVGTKRADTHASTVAAAIEFFDGTIGRRH